MAANDKLIRMTVRLPNSLYIRLRDYANAGCACRTKVIVRAVELYLSSEPVKRAKMA